MEPNESEDSLSNALGCVLFGAAVAAMIGAIFGVVWVVEWVLFRG